MKVGYINSCAFNGISPITQPNNKIEHPLVKQIEAINTAQIKPYNLNTNMPIDFRISAPQTYKKTGEAELPNGTKIHSYKLANGYRVTIVPMEGSPATVKNYVNVGSMNETDDIKGISHFLEHMAFNGTTGENGYAKLKPGDSFDKIDKLGGWTNASTSFALTDYVNSTPLLEEKDLEEQIKIIAAMTEDLALTDEMIEKEKGPVCSEINMILDRPETIAFDQTVRTLFNIESSADELIAGSTKHIQNLTRADVKKYYDKYYTPDNMNLVITGDIDPQKTIELVAKNFHSKKIRQGNIYNEKLNPIKKTVRKDVISNKATSTNIIMAFAGPRNNDIKSKIKTEILQNYIFSVNSGFKKDLDHLNTMVYLGSEKISTNPNQVGMLMFEMQCSENNSEEALKIVYNKLSNLKIPNEKELNKIKQRMIKDHEDSLDYSSYLNNVIGQTNFYNDLSYLTNYEEILNSITVEDINNYIEEYINLDKAAITLVHPKTDIDKIYENYNKANEISFNGTKRKPLNENMISESILNNNYKIGFVETKNNNIEFCIDYKAKLPAGTNPAASIILSDILNRGTFNKTEEDFNKILEDKNATVFAGSGSRSMTLGGSCTSEELSNTIQLAKELITTPRFTEKEFNIAIENLKDQLSQSEDSANSVYYSHIAKISEYFVSNEELKEGLKTLTLDDVKQLHKYILENSGATIAINIPQKNKTIKNTVIEEFNKLPKVKPYEFIHENVYFANNRPLVLTKAKNVSQADIKQVFRYEIKNDLKEELTLKLLNSILSSSSSIGLFNTLREKEQLAYSVYSDISHKDNMGELSLNILTTTDNKEVGEFSYENIKHSIEGFNRQINCLKNSEYTDIDLEAAKKILKAELLEKEGTFSKVHSVARGMARKEGINIDNQAIEIIDSITREDIQKMATKIFRNPPVYSIVASEDTLNANAEYLEKLRS